MKIKSQILVVALMFLLVVGALVGIYVFEATRIDMSSIEYIDSMMKGPNEFLDLANDINVESADDLGFKVNSDYNITIYYGDQVIEMNKNCFESEEFRTALDKIGVNVLTGVTEEGVVRYKVTYWGEDIDQYSMVE